MYAIRFRALTVNDSLLPSAVLPVSVEIQTRLRHRQLQHSANYCTNIHKLYMSKRMHESPMLALTSETNILGSVNKCLLQNS